jgi:aspartate/glutamate racemase
MKTLGIIGGIGPESTIEYCGRIDAWERERIRDGSGSIDETVYGVQILDTTQMHVKTAVAQLLSGTG